MSALGEIHPAHQSQHGRLFNLQAVFQATKEAGAQPVGSHQFKRTQRLVACTDTALQQAGVLVSERCVARRIRRAQAGEYELRRFDRPARAQRAGLAWQQHAQHCLSQAAWATVTIGSI